MYHVVVRLQPFMFIWHPSLWCIMLWLDSRPFMFVQHSSLWCVMLWSDSSHLCLFDIRLCDVSCCGQIPAIYVCSTSVFVMYHAVVRFPAIYVYLTFFYVMYHAVVRFPAIYVSLTFFYVMYLVMVKFQTFIFVWHLSLWCIMLWSDSRHLFLYDILLCDVSCCGQIPDIYLCLTSFFVMYHVVVRFQPFIDYHVRQNEHN